MMRRRYEKTGIYIYEKQKREASRTRMNVRYGTFSLFYVQNHCLVSNFLEVIDQDGKAGKHSQPLKRVTAKDLCVRGCKGGVIREKKRVENMM